MKKYLFAFLGASLIILFVFISMPAQGQSRTYNMSGWAWSANTGWLSFNCSGTSSCANSDYGVNIEGNSGDQYRPLVGYAWSSNIGWVQFGDLSGFPAGSGTQPVNARLNTDTEELEGWAKAISAEQRNDGWDGWISLSGDGYGISLVDDKRFEGYAWSADSKDDLEVGLIGWLDFNPTFGGVTFQDRKNLQVELEVIPPSGQSPLEAILVADTSGSTASDIEYRFKCRSSEEYDVWQSSDTYTGCIYTQAETAFVEVRASNAPNRVDRQQVFVSVNDGLSCRPVIGRAFIGQDVLWEVVNPEAGVSYIWSGEAVEGLVGDQIVVSYTNEGQKSASVSYTDSNGIVRTVNCLIDVNIRKELIFEEF